MVENGIRHTRKAMDYSRHYWHYANYLHQGNATAKQKHYRRRRRPRARGHDSQQIEVTAIQTDMLDRLLSQVENNNKLINDMQSQLNDLKARNAELETYKNQQAEQIDRLKARVAQLEAELKYNDLPVPSPEGNDNAK